MMKNTPCQSGLPPLVSVVIPCRNEEKYIGPCLESLLNCGYPHERLEILVVDGMSTDGTAEVVAQYASRYPAVRFLSNPQRIAPTALNIGIRNSTGDYVMRMDAHAGVDAGYIQHCVDAIQAYGADNVGGPMQSLPSAPSVLGQAIALALSHPFGVGNSAFRTGSETLVEVDTVFGGFYRRDVFSRVGYFNERLARGQDMEFNIRLKRLGGRILMVPNIVSRYYTRSSFLSFLDQNWKNGRWIVLAWLHSHVVPVRWRHLVPGSVVVFGALLLLLSLFSGSVRTLFLALCAAYVLLDLSVSAITAFRRGDARLFFVMPIMFAALHIGYGAGTVSAVLSNPLQVFARMRHRIASEPGIPEPKAV